MKKYLAVDVYRNGYRQFDCSNRGISLCFNQLYLECEDGNLTIDELNNKNAIIKLYYGPLHTVIARPAISEFDGKWYEFGGNFIYSSDSRFTDAVSRLLGHDFYGAIPVHDRTE